MSLHADVVSAIASVPSLVSRAWMSAVNWLTKSQRDSLLTTSGIAHRIVWSVPEDALAQGWTTEGDDQEALDKLDDRLRLEDRLLTVAGAARADGGAWLWLVVRGDDDFAAPLGEGPHDIAAVHVVERDELVAESWSLDLESPDYARPEIAQVTLVRDGISTPTERVHGSRLVYVSGMQSLPTQTTYRQGYDLAALQVYEPAIRDLERAWGAGATLIERLSMPQLRVVDFSRAAADDAGWRSRLTVFLRSMTTKGLMVIMGTDELTWTGPSVTGYAELLRSLAERLSSVEGIPLTRLLGQAPAGLTSDDASGTRTYYDLLERYRRTVLRPVILDVYRIAAGDAERKIVWPSLDKPSSAQLATISLQNAQRDAVLIQSGVIDVAEARARFEREGEMDAPVLDELYDLGPALEQVAPEPPAIPAIIEDDATPPTP